MCFPLSSHFKSVLSEALVQIILSQLRRLHKGSAGLLAQCTELEKGLSSFARGGGNPLTWFKPEPRIEHFTAFCTKTIVHPTNTVLTMQSSSLQAIFIYVSPYSQFQFVTNISDPTRDTFTATCDFPASQNILRQQNLPLMKPSQTLHFN